jgi:hypothetical protein
MWKKDERKSLFMRADRDFERANAGPWTPSVRSAELPVIAVPAEFKGFDRFESRHARDYLISRGVGPEIWARADLKCCVSGRYAHRVIAPVLSPSGDWWGFSARDYTDRSERKYINSPNFERGRVLYNQVELHRETLEPLVLVEGVFDALTHLDHAVACLGKPTSEQLKLLAKVSRPVVVCLDGDAWKDAQAVVMQLRLLGVVAKAIRLPPGIDPGNLSPDEFRAVIGVSK